MHGVKVFAAVAAAAIGYASAWIGSSAGIAYAQSSWVDKLQNPRGGVCCFNYDGQRLEDPDWRIRDDAPPDGFSSYQIKHGDDGAWHDVPDWAVVGMRNQDGIARVWWFRTNDGVTGIRCFLPGSLS